MSGQMDAIQAWRPLQSLQPAIAVHERQLAERQRGPQPNELGVSSSPPTIAAVAGPERGAESSASPRSDDPSGDDGAQSQAQEIAELQRRQELLMRDIELRLDLACDTVRDAPLPPVLEFEYGDDGRAYAVEPARAPAPESDAPASVPAAVDADTAVSPSLPLQRAADPAREERVDDRAVAEPTPPPEPRAPAEAPSSAQAQRVLAFSVREPHPSPGSRLDDTV